MGKSLPIFNAPSLAGAFGSIQQQVSQFFTPSSIVPAPHDGRTVDDFKPYLIALNLTKRCNLKCDHCYLDATTKSAGGDDELRPKNAIHSSIRLPRSTRAASS